MTLALLYIAQHVSDVNVEQFKYQDDAQSNTHKILIYLFKIL